MLAVEVDLGEMQVLDHERLRELREAAGLTQTEAARRAEISVSRWNDIERGRKGGNVELGTIGRIAQAVGCFDVCKLITPPDRKLRSKRK